jgi:hypothetical protein
LMGVSPIACGAPGNKQGEGSSGHFCLDMAPSVAARGKVYKALRRGEKIPTDWALDKEVSSPWRGDLSSMGGYLFGTDWISTGEFGRAAIRMILQLRWRESCCPWVDPRGARWLS